MSDYSSELIAHYEGLARSYTQPDFALGYDEHRPSPPKALLDALCIEAQVERPARVVDLGSGTGLSTRVWAERAAEVIGVEASDEMRARAEQATGAENVRYVHAFAQQTGLEEASADLVTASQSFHWMDATTTLAEIARILRPGGVFAAYDYDWPPVCNWEVEAAFTEMVRRVGMLRPLEGQPRHTKDMHLERMRDSGHFRFVREIVLHSRERGDAARIIGMALSLGPLVVLLERGMTEDELGLAQLRETATSALGAESSEWFISYRVRLGVE
jgi:ubiquinone/menaquinone biosynthesis C-methylase UbiE